jgi:Fe-S cluster biogenesis protein NfuA
MKTLKEKVNSAIRRIRPYLQRDGGDIKLVAITDGGVVRVRLTGACKGCPMASSTLKNIVEMELKKDIPEIKKVISV